MLKNSELQRYTRQIRIKDIGILGQTKIKNAKVFVVGAGGLGCPILIYLASMGVGEIGFIDNDFVDETNLHRQILFSQNDLNKPKAEVAHKKLKVINPYCKYKAYFDKLDCKNVIEIFSKYDIIVEASDNFSTKYLSNDACVILNKPLVYASANSFMGQVAVFNYKGSATLRCIFPKIPDPLEVPTCSQTGVLGSIPGIIGNIQATEVIKIITGIGEILSNGILCCDFLKNEFFVFNLKRNTKLENITELKENEYNNLCEIKSEIKTISKNDLKENIKNNSKLVIIDVRDPFEENTKKTIENAENIPYYEIAKRYKEIPKSEDVVIFCRYDIQSIEVISYLQNKHNYKNLVLLKDGIAGWYSKI